jgi:membrane protein
MAESQLTTKEQLRSIWRLGGLSFRQLAKRVWSGITEDNVVGRSSELAYNFLLAIFPFLVFLLTLFGIFASRSAQLQSNLFFYLAQILPPAAYDLVSKTINEVIRSSTRGKLTFGIVFALWAASGGMTTMISVLNGAYRVREARSWLKVHLIALGLTIAISLLLLSALVMVLLGGQLAEFMGAKLHLGSFAIMAWKVLQWPAALFLLVVAFSLIYYVGPDVKEQHWYWITPGSVFGVALWLAASFGLRLYIHFFNTYSKTYGSLGAVIILLLWFYVTGLAFMLGAEINSEIEQAAARRGHPEAKLPGQKAA